ncbi:hypothetical protein [Spirillospora sp. NPDC047279]|uniref:hypothetical protein n=1 Tax=Spirillospora sp. NPDC047279 TaxID=3155478 RepID=UPI0033CC8591
MEQPAITSTKDLLRSLYLNRTGILLLIMLLGSIGLIAISARTAGAAQQFWLAVGSGTLATTVYSTLQVFLTTTQFEHFLVGSIRSVVESEVVVLAERVLQESDETRHRFLPTSQYPGSTTPDPTFNRDINASFQRSDLYIFRGMTGKYSAARLALLPKTPSRVQLIIADPTEPKAVDNRARLLLRRGEVPDLDEGRKKVIHDIHLALAGMQSIHAHFDELQLCFTQDPFIDRVEIFDQEIYVELFSDVSEARSFPPTVRFSRESVAYQTHYRDCSRLLSSSLVRKVTIQRDSDARTYLNDLKDQASIDISMGDFEAAREEFREFRERVKGELVSP